MQRSQSVTAECFFGGYAKVSQGEMRIFNQITETLTVNQIAEKIQRVGKDFDCKYKKNSEPSERNGGALL